MSSAPFPSSQVGTRVVICDYNSLLLSVTGLLRMSGYAVFQAYDGAAAQELCRQLPNIGLLVLNTEGTGMHLPTLIREIHQDLPSLPVLHIGPSHPPELPAHVMTIAESFTPDQLLTAAQDLVAMAETAPA